MDNTQTQLVEKLQASTNILVTVSRNPTVDQLSACVALTLLLNKLDKHATAVFSGEVPSTLEFLKPEETLEKTTDSLRDFIIALDKTKADKLRYKVEDDMVRIFITPYRVSITDKDLEFSQGDFNVDVVVALGVSRQEDFDEAITAHGRILHDATVISVSTHGGVELGGLNWSDSTASSLSELVVRLARALGDNLLDQQVATALLTGIVSETERFSNEKTTPQTMSVSAELMAAGANQQLVATQLSAPAPIAAVDTVASEQKISESLSESVPTVDKPEKNDGTLEIDHNSIEAVLKDLNMPEPDQETPEGEVGPEQPKDELQTSLADNNPSRLIMEPPTMGGRLTANSEPESLDPANDILGLPSVNEPQPALLSRPSAPQPERPENTIISTKTLSEIEAAVHEHELATGEHLDVARDEVSRALSSQPAAPVPVQSLGAQPLGDPLRPAEPSYPVAQPVPGFADVLSQMIPAAAPAPTPVPAPISAMPEVNDPTAPPPVPPPIPFSFGPQPPQQ